MSKKRKVINKDTLEESISDAPTRDDYSPPVKFLIEYKLIVKPALDYGSGYGYDSEHLQIEAYDPIYGPKEIKGSNYKTIICIDVVNQLENIKKVQEVLTHIESLLDDDGAAFISVPTNSDIKLSLQVLHRDPSYILYILEKDAWAQ